MERGIENIGFNKVQLQLLLDSGYETIEELCKADKEELISKIGNVSYYAIKRKFHQSGLFFEFEHNLYEKIKVSLKNGMEIHYELLDLGQLLASSFVTYLLANYNKETFNYKDIIKLSVKDLVKNYRLGNDNLSELFFIVHMLDLKLADEIKGNLEEEIPEYRKTIEKEEINRKLNMELSSLVIERRLSKKTLEELKKFGYKKVKDICSVNYQDFVMQIENKDMIEEIVNLLKDLGLSFIDVDKTDEMGDKIIALLSKLGDIKVSNSLKQQKLMQYRKMILEYQMQVTRQADLESSIDRMSKSATELRYIEKRLKLMLK